MATRAVVLTFCRLYNNSIFDTVTSRDIRVSSTAHCSMLASCHFVMGPGGEHAAYNTSFNHDESRLVHTSSQQMQCQQCLMGKVKAKLCRACRSHHPHVPSAIFRVPPMQSPRCCRMDPKHAHPPIVALPHNRYLTCPSCRGQTTMGAAEPMRTSSSTATPSFTRTNNNIGEVHLPGPCVLDRCCCSSGRHPERSHSFRPTTLPLPLAHLQLSMLPVYNA